MEFGLFTMPLHPPGTDYTAGIEGDLEQVEVLDRLGYREAWIGEHFTSEWENIPAPDLFIAAALQRTSNILLGTNDLFKAWPFTGFEVETKTHSIRNRQDI